MLVLGRNISNAGQNELGAAPVFFNCVKRRVFNDVVKDDKKRCHFSFSPTQTIGEQHGI